MRALTLVAFALIVAAIGADAQTAGTTQALARSLEDRWQNCSRVSRGRLQAAHPTADEFILDGNFTGTYEVKAAGSNATISYPITTEISPCLPRPLNLNGETGYVAIRIANPYGPQGSIPSVLTYDIVASPMTFKLPQSLGEVASFTSKYTFASNENEYTFVTLTVQCGNTDAKSAKLTTDGNQLFLTLTDINACPRFPYTNEDMPKGGIAALIVVIVVFVIEFSICGWYHKTHKIDVPFADRDNYQNLDQ